MEVILVDENDKETGTMEKLEAHRQGVLHRAFSIFVFNNDGEMLLQQRAMGKYHSGGLWTNACCSHPSPGETTAAAANRRLKEEMGMTGELAWWDSFIYRVSFTNGLTEFEYDHVFRCVSDLQPDPDPAEVMAFRWMKIEDLQHEISESPGRFTFWFLLAMKRFYNDQTP